MKNTSYLKNNYTELFIVVLGATGLIGSQPNYVALTLCILGLILLITQQKYVGITLGIILALIGLFLCLALLSDAIKIVDFYTLKSIKFVGIGSLLCLSLIVSGIILIKKYFSK